MKAEREESGMGDLIHERNLDSGIKKKEAH
jgi:hypothetical protein